MIIDSHAHVVMPPQSLKFMSELVGGRGNPSVDPKIPDEAIRKVATEVVTIMDLSLIHILQLDGSQRAFPAQAGRQLARCGQQAFAPGTLRQTGR